MSDLACGVCGKDPAAGLASITRDGVETFYCHGDGDGWTCYQRAEWKASLPASPWWTPALSGPAIPVTIYPATCWHDKPCGEDPCPEREHYLEIEDSEMD